MEFGDLKLFEQAADLQRVEQAGVVHRVNQSWCINQKPPFHRTTWCDVTVLVLNSTYDAWLLRTEFKPTEAFVNCIACIANGANP